MISMLLDMEPWHVIMWACDGGRQVAVVGRRVKGDYKAVVAGRRHRS